MFDSGHVTLLPQSIDYLKVSRNFFSSHQGNKVLYKQVVKPWDFFETSLLFSRQLCLGQVKTGSRSRCVVVCSEFSPCLLSSEAIYPKW